jgi:thiol-disulfide isomerase/thioredoxin
MQKILFIVCALACTQVKAQTAASAKDRVLYGILTADSLLNEPFKKWYGPNYTDYKPEIQTIAELKKQNFKDVTVKIFFGTWCGDSKREVPRFYKLMDTAGFNRKNIQLIGLGNSDTSLYKKCPTGEEKGLGIFRVPVFIFYKNGKEINRINEYPAFSLEKDVLSILKGENYTPNYASFTVINKWQYDGTLADDNTNAVGLANQLKTKIAGENELNSLGYFFLRNDLKKEALKIFKINYNLFPSSANIQSSLGEGFLKNGDKDKAVIFLELALKEIKDDKQFSEILNLLYLAKGVK